MDWLEYSVTTDSETAEAVIELFNRYSHGGAVVETPVDCLEDELALATPPAHVIVRAYLPADEDPRQPADPETKSPHSLLEEGIWHLSMIRPLPQVEIRRLAEQDWANAWKQQYHVLHIGRRTRIVPAWEEYDSQPDEIVVRLEPGMAFGTGLHPTTRLCLEAMESSALLGCSVLDVGTGSGVLAIAAAKLGATSVLALDTDPVAVAVAAENVARNQVSAQVTVRQGSVGQAPGWSASRPRGDFLLLDTGTFDRVVVNILAPVIIALSEGLAARTALGGRLIASGIIESQEPAVVDALLPLGFRLIGRAQETDWVALVMQREG
jgi:ribosomal protein L11 methyltransferase